MLFASGKGLGLEIGVCSKGHWEEDFLLAALLRFMEQMARGAAVSWVSPQGTPCLQLSWAQGLRVAPSQPSSPWEPVSFAQPCPWVPSVLVPWRCSAFLQGKAGCWGFLSGLQPSSPCRGLLRIQCGRKQS